MPNIFAVDEKTDHFGIFGLMDYDNDVSFNGQKSTKLIKSDRLTHLGLLTLEIRRMFLDVIILWKIIHA